jgi:hypothetical protein
MKRSELREIVLEAMKGYSPQVGQTKGGTTDDFRNILTAIAKGRPEGDPVRGNAILDKANPDNVARISRGEKPVYEGEGEEKTYRVEYYTMDRRGDDIDWDETVQATSEEDAIAKVKANAPRLARAFSAKLK